MSENKPVVEEVKPTQRETPPVNPVLLTHFSMKRAYQDGEPLAVHIEEGNPAYIAPEQSLGMLGTASDIYAVGVLLYRLLGGMLPYDGEEPGMVALKHTNEPIPSLRLLRPEIPEKLELVVRMALAKSPEARFPSAAALAQALHAALLPDAPQVFSTMPERRMMGRIPFGLLSICIRKAMASLNFRHISLS